jgi:hypothetical protein
MPLIRTINLSHTNHRKETIKRLTLILVNRSAKVGITRPPFATIVLAVTATRTFAVPESRCPRKLLTLRCCSYAFITHTSSISQLGATFQDHTYPPIVSMTIEPVAVSLL